MRGVALIALCGCNQVFGLNNTGVQQHEAPPPPPMCQPIGTSPVFTTQPVALLSSNCAGYVVDEAHDFALADCCAAIQQGPADSAMTMSSILPAANDCNTWKGPRLDPEGTGAIFSNVVTSNYALLSYDGSKWTQTTSLPFAFSTYDFVGAPSRWSVGPHVIARNSTTLGFDEFASANGTTWGAPTPLTSLALTGATKTGASLTPDGLRLVFVVIDPMSSSAHIYYSDRATLGSGFRAAVKLDVPGLPFQVSNPYLTEDCGELYYADTDGTIWVVRQ